MKENKKYKAICKCHACNAPFEVEFLLPPTEEDKLGFYCEDCGDYTISKEGDYTIFVQGDLSIICGPNENEVDDDQEKSDLP